MSHPWRSAWEAEAAQWLRRHFPEVVRELEARGEGAFEAHVRQCVGEAENRYADLVGNGADADAARETAWDELRRALSWGRVDLED